MLKNVLHRFSEWYQGTYIPPPPNDPYSNIVFISTGHYEQPPLAKILRMLFQFWLDHWKWIIGVAVAILAIIFRQP